MDEKEMVVGDKLLSSGLRGPSIDQANNKLEVACHQPSVSALLAGVASCTSGPKLYRNARDTVP